MKATKSGRQEAFIVAENRRRSSLNISSIIQKQSFGERFPICFCKLFHSVSRNRKFHFSVSKFRTDYDGKCVIFTWLFFISLLTYSENLFSHNSICGLTFRAPLKKNRCKIFLEGHFFIFFLHIYSYYIYCHWQNSRIDSRKPILSTAGQLPTPRSPTGFGITR